ncbi:hypothetical protein B484DRAFT_340427, partial [Ochromonadaceae sp. CCMP2298]
VCLCMCECVCMHMCSCICVYVYICMGRCVGTQAHRCTYACPAPPVQAAPESA